MTDEGYNSSRSIACFSHTIILYLAARTNIGLLSSNYESQTGTNLEGILSQCYGCRPGANRYVLLVSELMRNIQGIGHRCTGTYARPYGFKWGLTGTCPSAHVTDGIHRNQ